MEFLTPYGKMIREKVSKLPEPHCLAADARSYPKDLGDNANASFQVGLDILSKEGYDQSAFGAFPGVEWLLVDPQRRLSPFLAKEFTR